jgi:hypothetical protein
MDIFKKSKKKTNRDSENDQKTLGRTFLLALFVGIILILVSIIINDILLGNIPADNKNLYFFVSLIKDLMSNAGIAIIIAYFFTFVSGTRSFIEFIKDKLISIIITKDFLKKLSKDEQRDILYATAQPPEELSSNFLGIKYYFDMYITKFLSLSETHFRSAYSINAVAKIDKTDNVVCVDSRLSFRIFKVSGKIEKLITGYEDEKVKEDPINIHAPDGKNYSIPLEYPERDKWASLELETDFTNDPSLRMLSVPKIDANLKNELLEYSYLDVVKDITEFGNDHWHLYTFRITQPCDKFSVSISCRDNLIVKKTIPFGKMNSFIADYRDENRIINISCNEWLDAGSGVAILIAKQ